MPPRPKGARLWLRPAERDASGAMLKPARWIIRDGSRQVGTGCGESDRAQAEGRLAEYIASKYAPARRERPLDEIRVADVINIYLSDVVPDQARPIKATERAERLLDFFGMKTLADINGPLCRAYVESREGKGRSNLGTGGGAKRDLEDLRAAINHHAKEGLHRGVVRVPLPPRGRPRQRWLTRPEAARLLWACLANKEHQKGIATGKRPLRHLCRALLLGLYTGSRPGVCLTASWEKGEGRSWIDIDGARFHRLAEGAVETDKRQPPVKLAPRLLAHLKRWRRMDKEKGYVVRFGKSGGAEPIGSLKTALSKACALAGLEEGVTAYALRHTAASWLVAKGLPTRQVAEFLGTSETMIDRHYAHHAPNFQDAAADAIGKK